MREPVRDRGRLEHIQNAINDYYQIDEEGIWNVIEVDLPPLKAQIEQYLSEMK